MLKERLFAIQTAREAVDRALKAGADQADAVVGGSTSLSMGCRLGVSETLERSESRDLGLRVFVGQKQAIVSTSDWRPDALMRLAERAVAMARVVPDDPFTSLAEPSQFAPQFAPEFGDDWPDIESEDPTDATTDSLFQMAHEAEQTALAVPGISNSKGAEASWGRTDWALATSRGFHGGYSITRHSVSATVLAGSGTAMERDYAFSSCVHREDLKAPSVIGLEAGERAMRRLNPRKGPTGRYPVVFEPRVAQSLLGHLSAAISGPSIARGTSFLKDKLGERIFPTGTLVVDDPFLKRGLRSRPFDGEGLMPERINLVEDGRLTTWLLDLRSAKQLGLRPTGHASRGTGSPPGPSPTNMALAAGRQSVADLIGDIDQGLLVTELIGHGLNMVTGDYSRGAAGFWIEKGQITYAVSEITIAGNLLDMFAHLTPANDLHRQFGLDSPTVRIEGMTIAGC